MAELIYYDTDVHATADLYDILKAISGFWDSYDDEALELVKGGITLGLKSTGRMISGYGMSLPLTLASDTLGIAATEKGLIVHTGTATQSTGIFAIGCDKEGNWAGAAGSNSSPKIALIVADGVSSTNYSGTDTYSSSTMTQIIDLATDKGNFIFDDVRRVLYTPVASYNGKLTMSNGEKYVKRGGFALRYTE